MKNHPGAALPPSNRQKDSDMPGLSNSSFSQTVGSITTIPQGCQWCHKQYASKVSKLFLLYIVSFVLEILNLILHFSGKVVAASTQKTYDINGASRPNSSST